MSKYDVLSERLATYAGDEWRPSFAELENLLGFALPKAARAGRAWWANDPLKGHSRAWTVRGWEVGDVDHAAERVVFRRGAASGAALVDATGLKPLVGELRPAVSETTAGKRSFGKGALIAGSAAAVGLIALAARTLLRRRSPP